MKRLIIVLVTVFFCLAIGFCFINIWKNNNIEIGKNAELNANNELSEQKSHANIKKQIFAKDDKSENSLYTTNNPALSLYTIFEISKQSDSVKAKVSELEQNYSILSTVKNNNDEIVFIIENIQNYQGHEFELAKINKSTSEVTLVPMQEKEENTQDDIWEFDESGVKPLKHIKSDKDGNIVFVEIWNYEENNPIKYEKKNAENKTIAIKKEILDSDTKFRSENVIYDLDGSIDSNISIRYDGTDMVGFTYYNSKSPEDGQTIIKELDKKGDKVSEIIYSSDYKFKNKYEAEYTNGKLSDIKEYDKNENSIESVSE